MSFLKSCTDPVNKHPPHHQMNPHDQIKMWEKIIHTHRHFDLGMMMIKYMQRLFWVTHNPRLLKKPIGWHSQLASSLSMVFTEGEKELGGWWPFLPFISYFLVRWHGISSLTPVKPILIYNHLTWKYWRVYWSVNIS